MNARDLLYALMLRTGDNPNSLAQKTKVPQPTLFRLLTGTVKEPRIGTIQPLAKYFGVPVEAFLSEKAAAEAAQKLLAEPYPAPGPHPSVSPTLEGGDVLVWSTPDDLPPDPHRVWIDRWDYSCSAGDGGIQWEIRQKNALPFNDDFFKAIGSKPAHCKLLMVRGDSMEPLLFNKDMMMVDTSKTSVKDGGVYAVCFEDEPLVKQVFRQEAGALMLHSYNPKYPDRIISAAGMASLTIIGALVYRSGAGFAAG